MERFIQTVRESVARHAMLPAHAPALVMVSGGGDSVTMLKVLAAGVLGDRPLRVLHINHRLRGRTSDADETFVRELCDELDMDCRVVRYDVAAFALSEKLNLEDAGRRVRYRFADEELDSWCERLGLAPGDGRIVVAHTRDDRVETFFMRAVAGSGTGALAGILPVRDRVVRPLIDCDRATVRRVLEESGQPWREDESNDDLTRSRAFVRSKVVPAVAELSPSFRESLSRTMDLVAADEALLTRMALQHVSEIVRDEADGRVALKRELLRELDPAMARRVIRAVLLGRFPELSRLEFAHVEAIVQGLDDTSFSRDLPMGLRVVSEYGSMVISHRDAHEASVAPTLLSLPGTADMGPVGTMASHEVSAEDRRGDSHSVVIDASGIRDELVVDRWREGDRMQPLGMSGTRKLSDMLTDAKVPRRCREAIPVVRDGERIVWLAGVRMAEDYRITDSTKRAVRLTWTPKDMCPAT
jgi:tRNA(Ile)-lysidine synthase